MSMEALQKRIKTTTDLKGIVGTMKSLSTASILQYDDAARALSEYTKNIDMSLYCLIKSGAVSRPFQPKIPPERQSAVAVVIGSDNGLVGKFNRDVVRGAQDYFKRLGIPSDGVSYIAIGRRVSAVLERYAKDLLKDHYAVSNSVKSIPLIASSVLSAVEAAARAVGADRIMLFYNEKKTRSSPVSVASVALFPFERERFDALSRLKWESRGLPFMTIKKTVVASALIREDIMMRLMAGVTRSLQAEHHVRLENMQAAEKNIDENLEKMNLEFQQMRQEAITSELLDVISGAEALRKKI